MSATAARGALGITATGDALVTAASQAAARTAIGSTATGAALITAASAAAGRSAWARKHLQRQVRRGSALT